LLTALRLDERSALYGLELPIQDVLTTAYSFEYELQVLEGA
jgi:hypothetical protein